MRRNIKIDRFWDLFITADDSTTDLASLLDSSMTLRDSQQRGLVAMVRFIEWNKTAPLLLAPIQKNVEEGLLRELRSGKVVYAASAVKIGELKQDISPPDPVTKQLVDWVNESQTAGKLRVTAHGDAQREVSIRDGALAVHRVDAEAIVAWLLRNGLVASKQEEPEPRGLVRITMRTCSAARFGEFVGRNGGVHPFSVLGQMRAKLKEQRINGIELVGLNEIVVEDGRHLSRTIGMPSGYGWGRIQQTEEGGQLGSYEVSVPSSNSSFTFFPDHFVLSDHVFEKNRRTRTLEFRPKNNPEELPALTLSERAGWVFVADEPPGHFLFYYPTNWQYDSVRNVLKTSDTTRFEELAKKGSVLRGGNVFQKAAKSGAKIVVIS